MPLRRLPAFYRYALFLLAYAVIMALYVWYTSPNEVPAAYRGTAADPATFFSPQELSDSETLSAVRNWIFFVSWPWHWLIYLGLLLSGMAGRWRAALQRTRMPVYVWFPLFVLLVDAVSFLLYLPIRVASYSVSRSYGITTQPALGWLRDKLVDFGIGYATMLAVSAVSFWVISRGGRWWLKLWLLSVPFTLFMMYVQPVVIDPLYSKFTRLSDPALERRILDLAAKADIPAHRVYEVEMSNKTNALNAYVSGIGPSLRIVLWDTTLQRMTEPQIMLIMAHEMGHYVMHHLEWSAVGAVGSSLVVLFVGSRLYAFLLRRRGDKWGIRSVSDIAALPLVLLLMSVLSFVSLPISNAVSRHAEAAADSYGMKLIGSSEGAVSMYQQLSRTVLSDVNPPLLVKWFREDHPSDMKRIVSAERFAETHGQ